MKTNKEIVMDLWGVTATIPKGTKVKLVKNASGTEGDLYAIQSIKLLKELSYNNHDPIYRYAFVKSEDVEDDSEILESNRAKAQRMATAHILESIDSCGFEGCAYFNPCATESEKAAFSYGRFMSEYGWRVEQVGRFQAVRDWLSGLALNIAFYNADILNNAVSWGSLPADYTEKQADKILENYWKYMAMRLTGLWARHKLT